MSLLLQQTPADRIGIFIAIIVVAFILAIIAVLVIPKANYSSTAIPDDLESDTQDGGVVASNVTDELGDQENTSPAVSRMEYLGMEEAIEGVFGLNDSNDQRGNTSGDGDGGDGGDGGE